VNRLARESISLERAHRASEMERPADLRRQSAFQKQSTQHNCVFQTSAESETAIERSKVWVVLFSPGMAALLPAAIRACDTRHNTCHQHKDTGRRAAKGNERKRQTYESREIQQKIEALTEQSELKQMPALTCSTASQ
jgi:hypothetical protein